MRSPAFITIVGLLLAGCSTVPPRYQAPFLNMEQNKNTYSKEADLADDGYRDLTGVLHVHTRYSDGAGTFAYIGRVANEQNLDYLITTDHNTLKPLRDGKQGWYGKTLILVGTEISTADGHYVALNIKEEIDRERRSPQDIIDEVNKQGGLGFIAHPYVKKRWTDWSVTGYTGIEIYNAAHDAVDENRTRMVVWTLAVAQDPFYYSMLDRPYDPLGIFDAMIKKHGRLVGIGSTDAHEHRVMGIRFAPYGILFRMVRTHLLVPDAPITPEVVYAAIRAGHAYVSFELVTKARGFTWSVKDKDQVIGIMGDAVNFREGLTLEAALPEIGYMTLFKDGEPIEDQVGKQGSFSVQGPGAYRLEVSRQAKPWILSNPIYIQAAQTQPAALP